MASPRYRLSRAHKKVTYTGGNITLNATAVTDVHATALDIVLAAQVGDDIEFGISGLVSAVAEIVTFDVYSIVAAARVNPWGAGLSASAASTLGVLAWHKAAVAQDMPLNGSAIRTLVSGDLSAGLVTMRLAYAKPNVNARTLNATVNVPLVVWAKVLGPPDST